jgi:hypothetical protein
MGAILCSYPAEANPRELLSRFEGIMLPFMLRVVEENAYEQKLVRAKVLFEKSGFVTEQFPPWLSFQRDASTFGPMFEFSFEMEENLQVRGSLGRQTLSLLCPDPITVDLLHRTALFAQTIRGATVLVRDAAGEPVPFVVHPPS